MVKKSKSSRRWLQEHALDRYVVEAHRQGYRSRAVFKLQAIDNQHHLLKPGMWVIDLGAAPGSWSALAVSKIGAQGRLIAIDRAPIKAIASVEFIQGDCMQGSVLKQVTQLLATQRVDLVLSDMAPNMSGNQVVDQANMMQLAQSSLGFARRVLKPQAHFLVKAFQGEALPEYLTTLRQCFERVLSCKPHASRSRSNEIYLLAKGLKAAQAR